MVFFKNADMKKIKVTKDKNNIGKIVETLVIENEVYRVNLQPITDESKVKTWGMDIDSKFQIYSDTFLNVGDYILVNNNSFEVDKEVNWVSYGLYAIKEKVLKL
ncbi:MAG: hypothetical protein ACRDD7_03205 [Peptostreptococcaceae bacterium]